MMKPCKAVAFVIINLFPILAIAQTPPADARVQQIATQTCAACHGAQGVSASPAFPNLAGQHANYIVKQLMDFKSDVRKGKDPNNPMPAIAKGLSPEDMKALAAFYASQKPAESSAKNKDLALQGQKIYRGGNASSGLPACAACHAPNGAGIPKLYPRINAQPTDYTLAQLTAFRTGDRANDEKAMMRTIASRMTDMEMRALAEYIAGLR